MIADVERPETKSYEINILLETLSPLMQGVMEPMILNRTAEGREIKVRKVRSIATVMSRAELGWDKRPTLNSNEDITDDAQYRHTIIDIPVVGANAFRHKIRSVLATHLLERCGLQVLDFARSKNSTVKRNYHTLFSGGGLTKDEKPPENFWQIDTIERIYKEWPLFGLLGLSYAGYMLRGKLAVGQGYPLVQRLLTRFFYDTEIAYKRFPQPFWIDIHPTSLIQGRKIDELWAEYRQADMRVSQPNNKVDDEVVIKAGTRSMIMLAQYVPAGIPFGMTWTLGGATALESSALRLALELIMDTGIISFGGRENSGMGHLSIRTRVDHLSESTLYDSYIRKHAEAIRHALLAEGNWKSGVLHGSLEQYWHANHRRTTEVSE